MQIPSYLMIVLALIASLIGEASAQNASDPKGNTAAPLRWRTEVKTDKLDGSRMTIIQKTAFDTTLYPQRRPVVYDKLAVFQIACHKGKTILYFAVDDTLIASTKTNISYRIDGNAPAVDRYWEASADHTAIGIWSPKGAIAFLKPLLTAKKIFIRVEHNVFGRTEAEFDMTQFSEAIKPIRAACKW